MKKILIFILLSLSISCTDTIFTNADYVLAEQAHYLINGTYLSQRDGILFFDNTTGYFENSFPNGTGTYYLKDSIGKVFLVTDFGRRDRNGKFTYHLEEALLDITPNSFSKDNTFGHIVHYEK